MSDPIVDRRQRALEAYWDELGMRDREVSAQSAIEVATQVKITDDILGMIPATRSDAYDVACDIFRAAGFEVVE